MGHLSLGVRLSAESRSVITSIIDARGISSAVIRRGDFCDVEKRLETFLKFTERTPLACVEQCVEDATVVIVRY